MRSKAEIDQIRRVQFRLLTTRRLDRLKWMEQIRLLYMNTPKNSYSPINDEPPRSLLEVLFGTKIEHTDLGQGALEKGLELRVEQERTKQQYYRLENTSRSIELLKMARELGVLPQDIPKLFNGEDFNVAMPVPTKGTLSTNSTDNLGKQPLSYRFPPAGSTLPPKPVSGSGSMLPTKRAHSPARIGANAVAALNDAVALKEEECSTHLSPFMNRLNGHHSRNISLPAAKSVSPNIPSGMTSILSFGREGPEQPAAVALAYNDADSAGLRRASMVHKKHRRARSASSFGVIDLKMKEESKQQDLPKLKTQLDSLPIQSPVDNSERHYDCDEKTCSESSSRNGSPKQARSTNSVAKLLNSC